MFCKQFAYGIEWGKLLKSQPLMTKYFPLLLEQKWFTALDNNACLTQLVKKSYSNSQHFWFARKIHGEMSKNVSSTALSILQDHYEYFGVVNLWL